MAIPYSCPLAHLHLSGWEVLLILAVIALGGLGMLFFCYWPYRAAVNALARGPLAGKPAALFACAVLGGIAWFSVCVWGTTAVLRSPAAGALWLLPAAGIIGWFCLLVSYVAERRRKKAAVNAQAQATPAFQVWFQDLVVALLCYASGLAIFACMGGPDHAKATNLLPYAVGILVAGSLGLLIAADVARRSRTCQRPMPRLLLFVIVFAVFPVALPLALIAWWRWRRALARAAPSGGPNQPTRVP